MYEKSNQASSSISAVIHGDKNTPSSHYVDALQRFKRDYTILEQEKRSKKRQIKRKEDERRRNVNILREKRYKELEEENLKKILLQQKQSQYLHEIGAKRTANTNSVPVNPINLNYENNDRGRRQQVYDEQKKLNKMVRSHHLQTCGNSGYNIINGKASFHFEKVFPDKTQEVFQNKLTKYYSQFRLNPNP